MEIERKFLITNLDFNLNSFNYDNITQAYISISPVIRIRKKNDKHYLTCKSKGMLIRDEFEIEIDKDEYENLSKKIEGYIIKKKRYYIPYDNHIIELDIFEDHLQGLILAEVEFQSLKEANDFEPPSWFGTDVTMDKLYQNSYLAAK